MQICRSLVVISATDLERHPEELSQGRYAGAVCVLLPVLPSFCNCVQQLVEQLHSQAMYAVMSTRGTEEGGGKRALLMMGDAGFLHTSAANCSSGTYSVLALLARCLPPR